MFTRKRRVFVAHRLKSIDDSWSLASIFPCSSSDEPWIYGETNHIIPKLSGTIWRKIAVWRAGRGMWFMFFWLASKQKHLQLHCHFRHNLCIVSTYRSKKQEKAIRCYYFENVATSDIIYIRKREFCDLYKSPVIVSICKYMLLSRHQNAGQNHDIKIGNRCFENVLQFRYLGTTVTNQNLI
jgi:hypothetical protein